MYLDPKRLKNNKLTLRFDDYEFDLVMAIAKYQGAQPSALLRELVLKEATSLLDQNGNPIVATK